MKKDFIAINSIIHEQKLIGLIASNGFALYNENGLASYDCIKWLFNLVHLRKRQAKIVFVCYGFQRSNEFIFSTLPTNLRDKLFQSFHIRNEIDSLQQERESLDDVFFNGIKDQSEHERIDFERLVIKHSLNDLETVEYEGYKLKLANGKFLTITKGNKAISIYDIQGFFKGDSLREIIRNWCGSDMVKLLSSNIFQTCFSWQSASIENRSIALSIIKCEILAKLTEKVNDALTENNIHISRYHGSGAIASYILSRSNAKKSFHSYKHKRQLSPELHKAITQAYYAGRVEQLKLGTATNVREYDINSAYANAITFLPLLLRKPYFVKTWQASPFSLWFIEYDFTNCGAYFGLLPNRNSGNKVNYKLKGSGYFWQPEIIYLLNNYPNCIDIKYGFTIPYEKAPFTEHIETFYELRKDLRQKKNPLQKVIGLALSAIYGKFKQDKSHFHNLFYAGFITSFTRMQLLDATKGFEKDTIAFQTDAIHSLSELPVLIGDDLGEYKRQEYAKVIYLDSGIYQCYDKNDNVVKTKTQGFRTFNFEKAVKDLQERQTYIALAEFFIGHNMYVQNMFKGAAYLADYAIDKVITPLDADGTNSRVFSNVGGYDLTQGYIDSKPAQNFSGRESSIYKRTIWKGSDIASNLTI